MCTSPIWNTFKIKRLKSKLISSLGAGNTQGLNMIAKIGLCLREGKFSFNKNNDNMVMKKKERLYYQHKPKIAIINYHPL